MKNSVALALFIFLSSSSILFNMEKEKLTEASKSIGTFFSSFSEDSHLTTIEREHGQRFNCLNLVDCDISSLKELSLLKKKCEYIINSIDLSNNNLKKINLTKFLDLFPYLQELKVNASGVEKVIIDTLPNKFNLELMQNQIRDITTFIVDEGASCNFEGNFELTDKSKKNIKLSFSRPWLERFGKLDQTLHIFDDIKQVRTFFAFGAFLLYVTHGLDGYVDNVIIGRGALAFCFLSITTYLIVKKYYCDYSDVTYKGNFKF